MNEDFYDEYNEFDRQVEEFKDSLRGVVKKEYLKEMQELKKENLKLQDVKNSLSEIKEDYLNKTLKLETEKKNLERNARACRLSELMSEYQTIMYKANQTYTEKPKCNECDAQRNIEFLSPQGIKCKARCKCSIRDKIFEVYECYLYEFRINIQNTEMLFWYKITSSGADEYCSHDQRVIPERIFNNGKTYNDIVPYSEYFKEAKDCQEYCDWLNKEEEK